MSNNKNNYLSEQVQRTLKVIRVMAGNEVHGISPGDIARTAEISSSNVTRVLANLKEQQFVEELPWDKSKLRLAPALVQISNTVAMNLRQHQQQLQQDALNLGLLAI